MAEERKNSCMKHGMALFFLQVSLIRSSYLLILIFITLFRGDFVYFMIKGDLSRFRTHLSVVLWISVSTSFGVRWFSYCVYIIMDLIIYIRSTLN